MGLTGHILEVELTMQRVPSPWIRQRSLRIADLDEFLHALKDAAARFPFTVGWIDGVARDRAFGRGILMAGEWAVPQQAPSRDAGPLPAFTWPFELPGWVLGRRTVKAFNAAFYWRHAARVRERVVHWQQFFYPLDRVRAWNRLYGSRGFTQYQCVVPEHVRPGATRRVLEEVTARGGASFLCVIKDCGPEGSGLLSFPTKGISLALDLPVRDDTQALIDALNLRVIAEGGRIYLAKDTFTRPEHFRAMDSRLDRFLEVRRRWDPDLKIRSAQSVRLFGDPA
jgi:hypothetical protein